MKSDAVGDSRRIRTKFAMTKFAMTKFAQVKKPYVY